MRQHEGVEDVAVLGVPDGDRGELVKAVVVPKDGRRLQPAAFDEFARQHLEVHSGPGWWRSSAAHFPRDPLGKVLRRVLRDQHLANQRRSATANRKPTKKPNAA